MYWITRYIAIKIGIQDKYKDKRNDQEAMLKMQAETKAVYEKYGTSQIMGTGSYPPFAKGLHLNILLNAIHPPFNAPYCSTASRAYWEQVG